MVIAQIACGPHGEDLLTAVELADGTIAIDYRSRAGRTTRHVIAPDDTLRISSEIWGKQRPNMETELEIVRRNGTATEVAQFEYAAAGGVHANEVGEFASAVADASGCGVNVLPTHERTFSAPELDSDPPRATPTPPPAVRYADRLGAEIFARLETLVAVQLPDGQVVVESSAYGFVWRINAPSTLVVWPHEGVACVETTLSCIEQPPELGEFEWNPKTKSGIEAGAVVAFAQAISERSGCTVHVETLQDRLSPTPVKSKPVPGPPVRPSYVYYSDRPGVMVIATLQYLKALRLPDGTVVIERQPSGVFRTISATDTLAISPWHHSFPKESIETWLMCLGSSGSLGEFDWDPVAKTGVHPDEVAAFANVVGKVTGCKVTKNEPR